MELIKKIFKYFNKILYNIFNFTINFLIHLVVPFYKTKQEHILQSSSMDFFYITINEKNFIDTVEKLTIYVEKKK